MSSPRFQSSLPIAGVLVLVAGALGWLLFGFAGDLSGRRPLPDGDGSSLELLVDPSGVLTFAEVQRVTEGWRRATHDRSFFWAGGQAVWARATLRNPENRPLRAVLADQDYFLDRVEAWSVGESEAVPQLSGEAIPARDKAIPGREVAFSVTVPARGERVIYVRMTDRLGLFMRWSWWPSQAAFQTLQTRRMMAEGLYLGILFALFGYNILLWVRLRVADIGYYVLYLGAAAVFIILARAHIVALGGAFPSPWVDTALVATMLLSGVFLTQFAWTFLGLGTQALWLRRGLRGVQLVLLALAVLSLSTPWMTRALWMDYAVPLVGLNFLALSGIALVLLRGGVRQARFFVLAFGCLFAGALPTAFVWMWQESLKETALQGLMIGSALEMMLLSLATADRFAQAQRDKVVAQARLVEETEQRRVIEEAYADELAIEVRERTHELEQANADKDRMLAVIGHDLRSPLTGLMKAADRSEGEFARETARTGRALLLMIEDLVLWARLRAGAPVVAHHPARALLAPAVALHRTLAERSGTDLVLEVPEDLRVVTDLVLAQTLVRNLLANALKFAVTRVILRAESDGGLGVRFTVTNDGPSLPAAVIDRLAAGVNEPMTAIGGLGLRLCREICAALDMRLVARVPIGGGAEFEFILRSAAVPLEEKV